MFVDRNRNQGTCRDHYVSIFGSELHRIGEQISKHLAQLMFISVATKGIDGGDKIGLHLQYFVGILGLQ